MLVSTRISKYTYVSRNNEYSRPSCVSSTNYIVFQQRKRIRRLLPLIEVYQYSRVLIELLVLMTIYHAQKTFICLRQLHALKRT